MVHIACTSVRSFAYGICALVVPNVLVHCLSSDRAFQAIIGLIAPLFAGLLAGSSGTRPVRHAILACALGSALLIIAAHTLAEEPPAAGRDLLPSLSYFAYSVTVGGLAARACVKASRE